jgi:chorismate mutase/prephenate dehydratase
MNKELVQPRVAFQGERGAFSEEAALRLLGDAIQLVPRPTFDSLFAAIREGAADYALAPLENSLAGSVQRSYDLLLESELNIMGEVVIRISHFLICCPGATFDRIETIESHPVALAQCVRFLAGHNRLRPLATEDTAGSVAQVIRSGDRTRAAIAGRRAAEIYGGHILREHLEDHQENYTRFALLSSSTEVSDEADKLSLVMRLPHEAGTLQRALEPFARRGLNLLKIESRPVRGRPWEYYFFLDLQSSIKDARVADALSELRARACEVRILGCYPSSARTGAN